MPLFFSKASNNRADWRKGVVGHLLYQLETVKSVVCTAEMVTDAELYWIALAEWAAKAIIWCALILLVLVCQPQLMHLVFSACPLG